MSPAVPANNRLPVFAQTRIQNSVSIGAEPKGRCRLIPGFACRRSTCHLAQRFLCLLQMQLFQAVAVFALIGSASASPAEANYNFNYGFDPAVIRNDTANYTDSSGTALRVTAFDATLANVNVFPPTSYVPRQQAESDQLQSHQSMPVSVPHSQILMALSVGIFCV